MTITTPHDTPSAEIIARTEILWASPATELWVAHGSGEYLGMVEFADGHFVANDHLGRRIDAFSDLVSAKRAVDGGMHIDVAGPARETPHIRGAIRTRYRRGAQR